MQKKLSAWMLLLFLHIGMAWIVIAAVKYVIAEKGDTSAQKYSHIISGWDAADAAVDNMLPAYDDSLKLRTELSLLAGNKKIGDVYIHEERLLREPLYLDEAALSETAGCINSFYEEYSVPTCMTFFPAAAEIYTECLPEHSTVPSQLHQLDEFYEQINSKIRSIDAYHVLSTFKDDYIYYRTDSRCTAYGAYCVYRSLIRKMGYYPVPYDSCFISHVKNDFRGDLYEDCLYDKVVPDILDVYTCENSCDILSMESYDGTDWAECSFYDEAVLSGEDAGAFYIGEPVLLTKIETDNENEKSLLIFKDSYGDSMLPFLVQHYTNISIVDMTCLDRPVTELVKPQDHQQVLIMCDADMLTDSAAFSYLAEEKGGNGDA